MEVSVLARAAVKGKVVSAPRERRRDEERERGREGGKRERGKEKESGVCSTSSGDLDASLRATQPAMYITPYDTWPSQPSAQISVLQSLEKKSPFLPPIPQESLPPVLWGGPHTCPV